MKVFVVKRTDSDISWCQDYEMTVIAPDKLTAINMAQYTSSDFMHIGVKNIDAIEINLDDPIVLTVANTGA